MKILVTGAGSRIGQVLCSGLAGEHEVIPWTSSDVNLLEPLSENDRAVARGVDLVLHLAWVRARDPGQAIARNREMLFTRFVEDAGLSPDRLLLFSSVAAGPGARSSYARAKYTLAEELLQQGGGVVVCGLVTSHPAFGPFLLFRKLATVPLLRPVFSRGTPAVYPVPLERIADGLRSLLSLPSAAGAYALFAPPEPMNPWVAELRGARKGLPVLVPVGLLLFLAGLFRRSGLPPWTLWDKLLTFFHKDAAYLDALLPIPAWRSTEVPDVQ